ncbi:MAG: hypothetical protein LAE24_06685 [Candidatus Contendobacter sp.]|jgi:hypothetical protein|nr:hypothetical protein [Candidatus Contendobacter sp.]
MKFQTAGLLAALASGGCALGFANDPQFQNWLSQAEAYCGPRYGALPFATPQDRAQFENMSYQAYYHDLPKEIYADRLKILYSDRGLAVDCLATALPRR